MKRLPWFEVILILVVTSITLYGAFSDGQNFSRRWFMRDDAYYYFKVAQNISEGHGSTFDGINKTNGYHPLWMLICVPIFALARFDLVLPLRVLFVVLSALSLATGLLLYRLIGKVFAPAIGALAALYWVFDRDILHRIYQQGLETGIAAFFIVLLVYKLYQFEISWRHKTVLTKDLVVLGGIGLCVILSRLDLVFLVAIAGIWILFRDHPLRYLLPLDLVSIAFSVLFAFVLRLPFDEYYAIAHEAVKMIAASVVIKVACGYLFGLYERGKFARLGSWLPSFLLFEAVSTVLLGMVMLVMARVLSFDNFPRTILIYDAIITFVLLGLTRLILTGLKTFEDLPQDGDSRLDYIRDNWARGLQEGVLYFGAAFGGLGIYMLWNKLAFGTFSPVSGQIKRWWGSLSGRVYGGPARTIPGFFGLDYQGDTNTWKPVSTVFGHWAEQLYRLRILDIWRYLLVLALFALLFYVILSINKKKAKTALVQLSIIPLLCASWLQVFYYHMLGYSAYKEWYWISQLILIVIVFSLLVGLLYRTLGKTLWAPRLAWAVAVLFGVYLGSTYWSVIRDTMAYGRWAADEPYMELATLLEQSTEPGSMIGMTGGGNVGYFIHDRTIINMDGLINSYTYFQKLKNKEAGAYLAELGMNYVMANTGILNGLPYRGQYNAYMEWMDINYGGKSLVRYHATTQP